MPEVLEKQEDKIEPVTTLPAVAVVGLGYVGLPVAVAFARGRATIGYDLSRKRIESLRHQVAALAERLEELESKTDAGAQPVPGKRDRQAV